LTDPQHGQTSEPADAPSEPTESSPVPEPAPEPEPGPEATAQLEAQPEVAAEATPIADPEPEPAPAPESRTTAETGQADRAEEAGTSEAEPAEAPEAPETPQAASAGEAGTPETPQAASAETPETQSEPVEAPPPPATVRRTVSQEVARQVWAAGARYCFTVPAEPILPLLDDLAAAGIRVVTTRHEGGAAFMAEALSQSTGRPQVVAISRTVGAANAAVGIHTASQDSAPMVVLTGQVATGVAGREAFQESDLVGGIGSLALWAGQIDRAADAPVAT